jgi:hypothetical protein
LDAFTQLNQKDVSAAGHALMLAILFAACVWHARHRPVAGNWVANKVMHLLWLIVVLILTGIIFAFAQTLLVIPTFLLVAALWRRQRNSVAGKPKVLFYSAGAINYVWSLYILLGWCAFSAMLTDWFIFETVDPYAWQSSVVVHRWLYYVVGFFGCLAPVCFMASFDLKRRPTDAGTQINPTVGVLVSVTAFIVFSFAPRLRLPWAWLAFWPPR